jgi:hypothetical protein
MDLVEMVVPEQLIKTRVERLVVAEQVRQV